MTDEEQQEYLDMMPRVFVRALRDPHGHEEFELTEGQATQLLRARETFNGGALFDALHLARNAIASLEPGALGWGGADAYPDPPYPIRDELLATIDAALATGASRAGDAEV